MTNTNLRIISALVLVGIVTLAIYLGVTASLIIVGLLGILVIDEFLINFLSLKRSYFSYYFSQLTFIGGFIFFNFIELSEIFLNNFNNLGVFLNFILLIYLFFTPLESKKTYSFLKNYIFVVGPIFLILFLNLASIFHASQWSSLIWCLLILNFTVDIFAWFFGKNFGKRKLWPKVSPKKTFEGAFGGVASSVIITSIYWKSFVQELDYILVLIFFILAVFSQLGDLIQSKMKRTFDIKDSSNLIPGHGGVYDRIDSLLFVTPFFALMMKLYYHI